MNCTLYSDILIENISDFVAESSESDDVQDRIKKLSPTIKLISNHVSIKDMSQIIYILIKYTIIVIGKCKLKEITDEEVIDIFQVGAFIVNKTIKWNELFEIPKSEIIFRMKNLLRILKDEIIPSRDDYQNIFSRFFYKIGTGGDYYRRKNINEN